MYSFQNDYSEGAHPSIMEAMAQANFQQNNGYSLDDHTAHAISLIKQEIQREDVDIHILVGGTQTNMTVISSALRPHQAVIAAHTGHINVHETGAIESTGHKVLTAKSTDGKLTPAMIEDIVAAHTDEHMVQPKMVYISNSTELGTQYSLSELEAISDFCRQHQLYLFLDGARLGAALTSETSDMTMADIARLTDVFYIGGTKNGALFGEALVICNPDLKEDFRFLIKQKGALLAKGFLLGIQFEQLFQNGLFYETAAASNQTARILREGIAQCGYSFAADSTTNQLFPIFPNTLIRELQKQFQFMLHEKIDEEHTAVRLVTSWATPETAVREFLEAIQPCEAFDRKMCEKPW